MIFSYTNHKKHKTYQNGCKEKEKVRTIKLSLNSKAFSRFLSSIWEYLKSMFLL